jgi:hydrogenase nickel incorporation protein HypA/HybF
VHELSIADAIARTALRHARGSRVTRVTVRVGHLRQVVPETLLFAWEAVARVTGPQLEHAQLEVEHVPAAVACRACGQRSTLDVPVLRCGACGGAEVDLLGGEELLVVSIELAGP